MVLAVCVMLAAIGAFSLSAAAEDAAVSVNVTVQYGQTEARSMLEMVNAFRTGSDAWYWNSDDTTKTVFSKESGNALGELTYDYSLERAAMVRAMEIALRFDHTRPNNTSCFTAYSGSYMGMGENIAAGYATAAEAFKGWQETDDPYSGQGHRRNMLDPNFQAVGIGHVYYNGCNYWVQEFGSPAIDTAVTAANDAETTAAVEILPSVISAISAVPSQTELTVTYGASAALPQITTKIQTEDTWPSRGCPVSVPYTWSAADGQYASVSSDSLIGNKAGTTRISATILGKQVTVPVTVEPASIVSASMTLAASSYTYDGAAKTPAVSGVKVGSRTLVSGTDYTVAYTNNTNAGTATVILTGKGNYTGTAKKNFTIRAADIGGSTMADIVEQTYTGAALTPAVTGVKWNGRALVAGADYTVAYANNTNAGTATVTMEGKGNYTGKTAKDFTIRAADIRGCTVADIGKQTYTGAALTPGVTLQYGSRTLVLNTDYTAAYANNVNVGTATVTLAGKGNFTGTAEVSFAIEKAAAPAAPSASGTDPSNPAGPSAAQKPKLPVGISVKDSRTKASYRVTSADASQMPTVEYVKPLSAKAASAVIPDTVTVNNVTCKVTSIAPKAFQNNKKLKKVTVGRNITVIGTKAFYGCTKLTAVKLGANVTEIGAYAFANCTSMTKFTIPAKVTKIGKQAFYGCKKLKKLTIKTKSLTSKRVGSKAFKGIYSKAAVKVPKSKVKAYKKLLKAKGIGAKAKISK